MESLKQRVFEFIQKDGLIQGEEILLVGVSGGPDSVCLLHILCQLKEALGVSLHVAHLDHMLRGADSAADARYVSHLAHRLGIPATVERRDVKVFRAEHRLSLEEAAREVRYDFFARVAESLGAKRIALGHTQDDQVETILMHLMRGTGLGGLRGMQPITLWSSPERGAFWVVRPLLEVTRKETEEYCSACDLEPRSDFSNFSPNFLRNRLRYELIPILRSYNPNVSAALLRTARAAAADFSFFEQQVSQVWQQVVTEQPNGLLLDSEAILSLHPALKRHLLRRVLGEILGELTDIQSIHIEKMMEALSKPAGKRLSLPRGLVFYVGYNTCLVTKGAYDTCPFPPLEGEHRLNLPGDTALPGWRVRASIVPPGERGEGFSERSIGVRRAEGADRACFDLDETGMELVVRGRKAGERFQPLGMREPKKLQDFMVDAKIPRSWRDRVPLVCSPDGILWVVGWRIAERVKVKDSTKQVLHLEFERV
ncbi:MAG: tRNA lysidine(34) synthetase TilS [Dehalococcoidia bacterium]|nr:tRNA lysidine(34) synthetase TilS [Dehalococcoidia bacterium]